MSGFGWDRALETGDYTVDEQHRELFTMVNELRAAVSAGVGRERSPWLGDHIRRSDVDLVGYASGRA